MTATENKTTNIAAIRRFWEGFNGNDKRAEQWGYFDLLGILQQVGAFSPLGQAEHASSSH